MGKRGGGREGVRGERGGEREEGIATGGVLHCHLYYIATGGVSYSHVGLVWCDF